MRAPASMSVLVQVALLAVFAVVASQAVVFGVVLLAPPPRPAGFSVPAAADALMGRPAETSDGRALRRRLSNAPPAHTAPGGPVEQAIGAALAQQLERGPADVRVWLTPERSAWRQVLAPRPSRPAPVPVRETRHTIVLTRPAAPSDSDADTGTDPRPATVGEVMVRPGQAARSPGEDETVRVITTDGSRPRFTIMADRLTFAPFSASVRLADGRWATVEPPHGLIDPWQARLLLALGLTALLLAPLVWLMARRLTQPIRAFAEAAERLGADPEAEPLTPSGPSEVRTAIAAFNDMQAAIRDHMRQRTQTIAAIAHDLRTPLTRLRFRAEQAPEALRDRMAADVEEMDALIGQAMAFVRGEAPSERREPLDLAALAADCAAGFAETGAAVTCAAGEPLPVLGDPGALRRAVANLIDNAIQYAGSAEVAAAREGDRAVVTVRDRGPGLAEAELETAFEPFQRGERSRSRQTGGAGLGLAVARQAARAAGGDVVLVNRPGGGLEARLALPLSQRDEEAFARPL